MKKEQEPFIKFNKEFIFLPKERLQKGEKTLFMKYGNKIIPTLVYIQKVASPFDGKSRFNLQEIIEGYGYNPRAVINQFKQALIDLENEGIIINSNIPMDKVKLKDHVICELDIKLKRNDDGQDINFSKLYMGGLDKILDYCKGKKISQVDLINLYIYFESRYWNKVKEGQAETFEDSYDRLMKDLDISSKSTVKNYIDILSNLRLLYYSYGNKKQNGTAKNMCNIYARTEKDLELELKHRKYRNKEKKDKEPEIEIQDDNVVIVNPDIKPKKIKKRRITVDDF